MRTIVAIIIFLVGGVLIQAQSLKIVADTNHCDGFEVIEGIVIDFGGDSTRSIKLLQASGFTRPWQRPWMNDVGDFELHVDFEDSSTGVRIITERKNIARLRDLRKGLDKCLSKSGVRKKTKRNGDDIYFTLPECVGVGTPMVVLLEIRVSESYCGFVMSHLIKRDD